MTSWGVGCASRKYFGVYARADKYRDWILSDPEVAPYVIRPPRITGRRKIGGFLRCSPGQWGGDTAPESVYQWVDVDRGKIVRAANNYYKIRAADRGRLLRCEVTKYSLRHAFVGQSKIVLID